LEQKIIGLDIGNTTIKAAQFTSSEVGEVSRWPDLMAVYAEFGDARYVVCSVGQKKAEVQRMLGDVLFVDASTPLPIRLDYLTPETLGADRIVGAVGAHALFPDRNLLLIDIGTCITYDLVNSDGVFRGGVISPGPEMRFRAMHQFTDGLPDLSSEWQTVEEIVPGNTTRTCMVAGVKTAIALEMQGFYDLFSQNTPGLYVILTGGLSHPFESTLNAPIFANSKIVLTGLHTIWKLNEGSKS
jgi:type III pantothenate kinase